MSSITRFQLIVNVQAEIISTLRDYNFEILNILKEKLEEISILC